MATKKSPKTASKAKKVSASRSRGSKKSSQMQSFKLAKPSTPFMTVQLSVQSFYWIVLGIIVIAFSAWILKLQSDIQDVYDNIQANDTAIVNAPVGHKK